MNAYRDVQRVVNKYGSNIDIYLIDDSNITRDEYNQAKKSTPVKYTLKAFPVTENPSDKIRELVGIKEQVNIIAYVSMLSARALFNFEDIDTEQVKFSVFGKRYDCNQIQRYSQYQNDYLYLVFAGNYESKI